MQADINNGFTIYRILNFGTKNWWAHRQLRDQGKHIEARRGERRDILSDVGTLRKARFVLIGHGRWLIATGSHCNVSGYGGMEYPLVLACVLLGVPCVNYSEIDGDTAIILPVPGLDYPPRIGQIGMLDDVSFDIYAAIAKCAGAKLYNIDEARIEKFAVSRFGNGWMVVDTAKDKITEERVV
jgi:hypothetical protein